MKELVEKPRAARLRRLSDEEIALWAAVAKSVVKRPGAYMPTPAMPTQAMPPTMEPPRLARAPSPAQPSAPRLQPLDKRLKRNLARGRSSVDAAIDLHGMTQAQAHSALRGFLGQGQMQGAKLVIVITGKGAGPQTDANFWEGETGVLRRLVPHWLRAPDLSHLVLGFEEAGRTHGGAGALYVRLRRRERH